MTTYSTQFALGSAGGALTMYTAPAGLVSVVRDIELFIQSGAVEPQTLLSIGDSGNTFYFYSSGEWQPNQSRQWQGRLVMNVGQVLQIWPGSAAHVVFVVSGYQLSG